MIPIAVSNNSPSLIHIIPEYLFYLFLYLFTHFTDRLRIFQSCKFQVEGIPVEEMLNRSFYKVFPNGDKKWLVAYADVALNGTKHTLRDYSPEIDKDLIIHCYQPEPGYCACVLQVAE